MNAKSLPARIQITDVRDYLLITQESRHVAELARQSCRLDRARLQAETLRTTFSGPAPEVPYEAAVDTRVLYQLLSATAQTQESALQSLSQDVALELGALEIQFDELARRLTGVSRGCAVQDGYGMPFVVARIVPLFFTDDSFGLSFGGVTLSGIQRQIVLRWDLSAFQQE